MKLDDNADGSTVVHLESPVQFDGAALSRLTIPALKGKHLRLAPWPLAAPPTLGHLCEFAASIVEPLGVFDELEATTARDVALHVGAGLGKRRATGEGS